MSMKQEVIMPKQAEKSQSWKKQVLLSIYTESSAFSMVFYASAAKQ